MSLLLEKLAELADELDTSGSTKEANKVDEIIQEVKIAELNKLAFVRRRGNKWVVLSRKGKVLGTHDTKESADRQLRAIEANK